MKKITELSFPLKGKSLLNLLLVGTLLPGFSGCSRFTTYEDGKIQPSATAQGTVVGALSGLALGSALEINGPWPTMVGGVVGGIIGTSLKEAWPAREHLRRAGVQVIQEGEAVTVYLPTDCCFLPNTDTITECCYPKLDQIVVLLKTFKCNVPMTVNGHTDDVGDWVHKKQLSDMQAKAVAAYFWAHGIPYEQLKLVASGDCDPVASNRNSCGSKANRRVQINIRPNLLP